MVKRIASAIIWFLVVGWGFNYLNMITGAPLVIGVLVGAAVSVFVGIDPLHLVWPARTSAGAGPAREAVPASGAMQTQV